MMEIYLKKHYASGKNVDELRHLALQIKETTLKDIATEFTINIAEFTIEVALDREKMKSIDVTSSKVADAISKQLKGYTIRDNKDSLTFKSRSKEDSINEAYKTKEKIKELAVKGIKGILQVLPIKREDEFIIITAGSNLADVLQLEEVDAYRTTTNNIFEIEQVLGIEAARQAIINEIFKVIEVQGLNVDVRHIMLVADTMCVSGTLKGITRYGVVSDKSSVLARASFETPIKHIINAALVGEVDNLDSVVENVMINQPVPLGTGLPSLTVKLHKTGKEAKEK
jgi:DNA-directed RNA polymerase subunit A"